VERRSGERLGESREARRVERDCKQNLIVCLIVVTHFNRLYINRRLQESFCALHPSLRIHGVRLSGGGVDVMLKK